MSSDPKKIALAIITYHPQWYQGKLRSLKHTDKVRGDLAIETLSKAAKIGYNIVVFDGKSSLTFFRELKKIPGIILGKRRSAKSSPAKRQAIRKASKIPGVEIIILCEAEKVSLIDSIDKISSPVLENTADIVVPKREVNLFKKTYPDYQYDSEVEGNRVYNEELRSHELLGKSDENLDMFFGPRVFRNILKIRSLFTKKYHLNLIKLDYPKDYFLPEAFSNTLYFPIILALQKKLRVASIEIPFEYPPIQKANEEKGSRRFFVEKRKAQYLSLTVELLHFVAYLEKYKGSRIKKIKN